MILCLISLKWTNLKDTRKCSMHLHEIDNGTCIWSLTSQLSAECFSVPLSGNLNLLTEKESQIHQQQSRVFWSNAGSQGHLVSRRVNLTGAVDEVFLPRLFSLWLTWRFLRHHILLHGAWTFCLRFLLAASSSSIADSRDSIIVVPVMR